MSEPRAVVLLTALIIDALEWTDHVLGNHDAASKLLAEAIQLDPKQTPSARHESECAG